MSVVLARGEAAYRIKPLPSSPAAKPRDYGELGAKIAILTLFSSMATRLAKDAAETGTEPPYAVHNDDARRDHHFRQRGRSEVF